MRLLDMGLLEVEKGGKVKKIEKLYDVLRKVFIYLLLHSENYNLKKFLFNYCNLKYIFKIGVQNWCSKLVFKIGIQKLVFKKILIQNCDSKL